MGTSGLVLSAGLCISDFFFLSFCAAAGEAQANASIAMMAADSATRNMREVSRVVNRVFIPRKTPFGRIDFSRELLEDSTAIFGRGACVQLVYLRFSLAAALEVCAGFRPVSRETLNKFINRRYAPGTPSGS